MPTTLPTVTGADMADGYRKIFDAVRLDVTFTIDELSVTSDGTAYALTRSGGTQTVQPPGTVARSVDPELRRHVPVGLARGEG